MPELSFAVESVDPMRNSASPTLVLRLKIANTGAEDIRSVTLNCQLQIWPARGINSTMEKSSLADLSMIEDVLAAGGERD